MKKSNKGFSLVELIVVVLIMAIIAVVLAPQVTKWVQKSRVSSDLQTLDSVASFAQMALTNADAYDESVKDKIIVEITDEGYTVYPEHAGSSIDAFKAKFDEYAGATDSKDIISKTGEKLWVTIDKGVVTPGSDFDEEDLEDLEVSNTSNPDIPANPITTAPGEPKINDASAIEINVGETKSITFSTTGINYGTSVSTESSNAIVKLNTTNPTVSSNKITLSITGESEGTTTITVTASGKSATCSVTVKAAGTPEPPVETTISLSPTSLDLTVGETGTIIANVTPSKSLTWSSDNTSVATVSNGTVTAVAAGSAKITARTEDDKTATCTVTVKADTKSVTLNPTSITMGKNKTASISATLTGFADGTTVTWSSSNSSKLSVSGSGNTCSVTSKNDKGTYSVSASVGGKVYATCNVTVDDYYVYFSNSSYSVKVGENITLSVNTGSSNVSWSSTPSGYVNLKRESNQKNCVVTGTKPGTVTVTASLTNHSGYSASVTVNVVADLSVKESTTLYVGDTETLTASGVGSETVTWTSSNEQVATVDSTGKITALKAGTATITASAAGQSDTCTVTVTNVTFTMDSSIDVEVGKTAEINFSVSPNRTVQWSSIDTSKATVNGGVVTGVAQGTTTITATVAGQTKTCTVNVTAPAEYNFTIKHKIKGSNGRYTDFYTETSKVRSGETYTVKSFSNLTLESPSLIVTPSKNNDEIEIKWNRKGDTNTYFSNNSGTNYVGYSNSNIDIMGVYYSGLIYCDRTIKIDDKWLYVFDSETNMKKAKYCCYQDSDHTNIGMKVWVVTKVTDHYYTLTEYQASKGASYSWTWNKTSSDIKNIYIQ